MRVSFTLFLLLFLVTCVAPAQEAGRAAAALPTEEPFAITLGHRRFVPDAGLAEPLEKTLAGRYPTGQRLHMVVQFYQTPKQATRDAGLHLLEPLPGGAYLAALDLSGALAQNLFQQGAPALGVHGVRSLFAAKPEDRLPQSLHLGEIPPWAASELDGAPAVDLEIYYHRDVPKQDAMVFLSRLGGAIIFHAEHFQRITSRLPVSRISSLANEDWISYIDVIPPAPRSMANSEAAAQMKVNQLHAEPYNLTGANIRLALWDSGRVDQHPEFGTRLTIVDNSARSSHSTLVAGTMAADGSTNPQLKGMAPAAKIFSYDFRGDVPTKMIKGAGENLLDVANNSWGFSIREFLGNCATFGEYGSPERDLDGVVRTGLTLVFSMGNERELTECVIPARGGFYTTSRPASAKNVISVGANDPERAITTFSSYGPTRDGRLKPDVTALGFRLLSTTLNSESSRYSGSSPAAAAISGLAGLMLEQLKKNPDAPRSPALVKAILLNTATDLGNPGPDYSFGYGVPDAVAAVTAIEERRYKTGEIAGGGGHEHTIEVAPGTPALRVMLAWSDPEGPVNAATALVNNLELVGVSPDGSTLLPLTLNPLDPKADARPRANNRDNVEQIVARDPAPGVWTIRVVAAQVAAEPQSYALTWSFDPVVEPPCSTTVTPSSLSLTERTGSFILGVTRGSTCPPWRPTVSDSWLASPSDAELRGSSVVKVSYDANPAGGPRQGAVSIGEVSVRVRQLPACTVGRIRPNEPVEAELTPNDCVYAGSFAKHYTFDASAGQIVTINMTSDTVDSFLFLLLPGGRPFVQDDDSGGARNARIPSGGGALSLPVTGIYTIVASTYDEDETGPFRLRLELRDPDDRFGSLVPPVRVASCPATINGTLADTSSRHGRRGELYFTNVYEFPPDLDRISSLISRKRRLIPTST